MGFIKWLKKEGHFSPVSLKCAFNMTVSPPTSGQNSGLRRNESYLKALTKFNKWRELHLKSNRQRQEQCKTTSISDLHYEEIDFQRSSLSSVYENESTVKSYVKSSTEKDQSLCRDLNATLEYDVEPNYALPYNSHDNCCPQAKIVTDLDKSLGESINKSMIYVAKNREQYDSIQNLCNSELLVYGSNDISPTLSRATSGYLKHGFVDAIEISFIRDFNDYASMLHSFHTLRKLRHPNITLLMGVCLSEIGLLEALILEPLKCTLFERIYWQKKKIAINQCLLYALQLGNAVIYLHKRSIVHSNIRSTCVLLCKSGNVVKLAGFEKSTTCKTMQFPAYPNSRLHDQSFYETMPVDEDGAILYKLDIYGVCITLWEMLNCVIPHTQLSQYATLPMYERDRCMPFKGILERGLEITEHHIESALKLREEFKYLQYKMLTNSRNISIERTAAMTLKKKRNKKSNTFIAGGTTEVTTQKRKLNVSIRIASNRN